MSALAWTLFGALVGTYGTLVGAGGGFLVVPALLILLELPHPLAVGTSLAVVTFNAVSGTWAYARRGLVRWRLALAFAAATVPGGLLGPHLLPHIPQRVFTLAFGVLLIGVAAWLILKPSTPAGDAAPPLTPVKWAWGLVLSFAVGFLSALLGIGGGIIHVPVLIYALGFPIHLAIATSHATLALSAAVSVGEHARLGHVRWDLALPMGLGALAGAQLGAILSRRIATPALVRALGAAIALVGIRCLWTGLSHG